MGDDGNMAHFGQNTCASRCSSIDGISRERDNDRNRDGKNRCDEGGRVTEGVRSIFRHKVDPWVVV